MIVLDTTVLVYAVAAEHPLRDSCRGLVAAVADGRLTATTTVEVIQELAHVRARRRGRGDAVRVAGEYAELLAPLAVTGEEDLRAGLQLFAEHEPLGAFDAVLAAVARARGATALASADAAFGAVPGIVHVIPDAVGLERLLRAP